MGNKSARKSAVLRKLLEDIDCNSIDEEDCLSFEKTNVNDLAKRCGYDGSLRGSKEKICSSISKKKKSCDLSNLCDEPGEYCNMSDYPKKKQGFCSKGKYDVTKLETYMHNGKKIIGTKEGIAKIRQILTPSSVSSSVSISPDEPLSEITYGDKKIIGKTPAIEEIREKLEKSGSKAVSAVSRHKSSALKVALTPTSDETLSEITYGNKKIIGKTPAIEQIKENLSKSGSKAVSAVSRHKSSALKVELTPTPAAIPPPQLSVKTPVKASSPVKQNSSPEKPVLNTDADVKAFLDAIQTGDTASMGGFDDTKKQILKCLGLMT